MNEKFKYIVNDEDFALNLALKDYLRKKFNFSSRLITKIKKNKALLLNGEFAPAWIVPKPNDVISVKLPEEKSNFPPENIPLDIIFEDEDLLIINKQPYIVVHPTSSHSSGTIANGVAHYLKKTNQIFKIRFVNRLDRDTSGILILGKNSNSQNQISIQMRENTISKEYIALVHSIVKDDFGTINLPIGRPNPIGIKRKVMDDGSPSVTHYKVLQRFYPSEESKYNPKDRSFLDEKDFNTFMSIEDNKSFNQSLIDANIEPYIHKKHSAGFTLLQLKLETGRTHQIRVHLSHIGHTLVGDNLYGSYCDIIDRQALHSFKLNLNHPVSKERISLEASLPQDILNAIDKVKN